MGIYTRSRTDPDATRSMSWRRRVLLVVAVYLALIVATHLAVSVLVALGRAVGDDPRTEFPGVSNFRVIDDRVWAGAQPAGDGYRDLAAVGVTVVVDMRTGADDDPNKADPAELAALGVEYLRITVKDGHVPSDGEVERFVDIVERANGIVFVHCGGGVGRTSALTTAYRDRTGDKPAFIDQILLGPHTVEQMWFVATGDSNFVVQRVSEALDAPRRAWSRIRAVF